MDKQDFISVAKARCNVLFSYEELEQAIEVTEAIVTYFETRADCNMILMSLRHELNDYERMNE